MKTNLPPRWLWAHALAWTVFIAYEVSIVFIATGPQQVLWWEYIGYYTLNILLFYCNAYGVISLAMRSRLWYLLLLLLIPLELALYVLLEYRLELFYNQLREFPKAVSLDQRFIGGFIWRGLYYVGLSTTYWFVLRTLENSRTISRLKLQQLQAQKENAELEKDLFRSQNAYLQAQINPHMLFNTLNFIYNSTQELHPKTAEGVLLLSEVMHYALARAGTDGKSDLALEVAHIKKYVALNQLRFRNPLHLHLETVEPLEGARLPPLVLLPLVENVFTHGDLTDPAHAAFICIACHGDRLYFRTQNKRRRSYPKNGYGIGQGNVRTRLEYFYPEGAHHLTVREEEINYIVDLQIILK